jgi:3-polyprenyl-4-hydroxybenzoate decarboxylase
MGSRWQPAKATTIIANGRGNITDPSSVVQGETSKIVIDATMQWPEEGGPKTYPAYSRQVLEQHAPDIFERIAAKWGL